MISRKFKSACLIAICALGLLWLEQASAQSPANGPVGPVAPVVPNSSGPTPTPVANGPVQTSSYISQPVGNSEYIVGQGDRLLIRVFGADDLTQNPVDVGADGAIVAPLVGSVKAGGLSVSDLQTLLTQKYSKFYKNPEVTVTVVEYRSQPVTVVGSVNTPGVIQLRRPTRLMDVISQAGGLRPDAGDRVFIVNNQPPTGAPEPSGTRKHLTQEIDLRKIIEGQDPSLNVLVRSNDLITVPKAKMVYVVGEVGRPGAFVLDGHSSSISVLEAIALAGGVSKTAATGQAKILEAPSEDSAHRVETKIDLHKILASRAPDVELHADEILFVPNSAAKSAGLRTLEMTSNVVTGLAIWRF